MRKFVAILFLLIVPLQWSTAAVAAYCQHETESKAQQHVGHHAHVHQASADLGGSDPANSDFDADCPSCLAHYAQVAIPVDHAATPICGDRNAAPYRATLPEPPLGSLFRPPLADLA